MRGEADYNEQVIKFFLIFFIVCIDNGDDIQSTDDIMLLPDNYAEDAKTQDVTEKTKDNNV